MFLAKSIHPYLSKLPDIVYRPVVGKIRSYHEIYLEKFILSLSTLYQIGLSSRYHFCNPSHALDRRFRHYSPVGKSSPRTRYTAYI